MKLYDYHQLYFSPEPSHLTIVTSVLETRIITRKLELQKSSSAVLSVADQVGMGIVIYSMSPTFTVRSPHVSPVHQEHAGECEAVSLAVYRVQDLHFVWNK